MSDLLTAAQMKAADQQEIERGTPSQVLMERAARAALRILEKEFDTTRVLFLCGSGNNGGDGFAMARLFSELGGSAHVCYTGPWLNNTPDRQKMSVECARQLSLLPSTVPVTKNAPIDGMTAVVDAIFGIGLTRDITGEISELISTLNKAQIPTLAIDIPSGIQSDSGSIAGVALRATHTVAIAALKYGHLLYPGASFCGKLHTVDIGIPTPNATASTLEKALLSELPPRPIRAHKGIFGRVLVIGGSVGMSGAGYLCARAAYRTGAGLVEIYAPEENRIIYQTQLPEALLTRYDPTAPDLQALQASLARAGSIAIGMGLGTSETTLQLLECVLQNARCPLLLDADALNVLAMAPHLLPLLRAYPASVVLTPHLGEAGRLLALPLAQVSADLPRYAAAICERTGAVTVLKDARTWITDGTQQAINTFGNSGMATGGSGDVLAGVIAALLAVCKDPFLAAKLGVLAHALAGDAARACCGEHGMMASDILDGLCKVLP